MIPGGFIEHPWFSLFLLLSFFFFIVLTSLPLSISGLTPLFKFPTSYHLHPALPNSTHPLHFSFVFVSCLQVLRCDDIPWKTSETETKENLQLCFSGTVFLLSTLSFLVLSIYFQSSLFFRDE